MLHDEQELLDYLTENYSDRKSPAKKEWTFQEHFNLIPEDLEDMLLDLFIRYGIEYSNFVMDHYFEPELFWFQFRLRKNSAIGSTNRYLPADVRWQKMSGWRLDFGGEETRIIMKNEWYLLLFNPVYELPEAKPCVLS